MNIRSYQHRLKWVALLLLMVIPANIFAQNYSPASTNVSCQDANGIPASLYSPAFSI